MEQNKQIFITIGILAFISYWFFFISTNVNPTLGNIYTNITIGSMAILLADFFFAKQSIKLINKNVTWTKAIMYGIGGYIILILSTQFTVALSEIIPLTEIINLLATSAPVFSQSTLINFITFGIVIALVESMAIFIIGLDLLASMFHVQLNKQNLWNPKLWMIMIGLAVLFLFLHITSKGVEAEATLILVFIMAIISMVLAVLTLDYRATLSLHLIANSIAATSIFNIFPSINKIIMPLITGLI